MCDVTCTRVDYITHRARQFSQYVSLSLCPSVPFPLHLHLSVYVYLPFHVPILICLMPSMSCLSLSLSLSTSMSICDISLSLPCLYPHIYIVPSNSPSSFSSLSLYLKCYTVHCTAYKQGEYVPPQASLYSCYTYTHYCYPGCHDNYATTTRRALLIECSRSFRAFS